MERANAPNTTHSRRLARDPGYALTGAGLAYTGTTRCYDDPLFFRDHAITPLKTIGSGTTASLHLSYWHATVEDSPQVGDPSFISASLRTSDATAWRNASPSGLVSMLPFEGADWRFEQPVSFVQFHLPSSLMAMVCDSLIDGDFSHDDMRMPADVENPRLYALLQSIRHTALVAEPTNLLLDSWALLLAEAFLQCLSSHPDFRNARCSFARIPGRRVARVIEFIETSIDQDLRLSSLADIAAMSMFRFARSFKETIGMTPHAYVLSRRIARARAMLSQRQDSLAQVALACGFSGQSHLTTAFCRRLGMTPGAYRRMAQ